MEKEKSDLEVIAENAAKRPQDGLHDILKDIRYHNPDHELNGTLVRPSDGAQLPFPHLSDAGYQLLLRKRVIAPAKS